MKIAAAILLLLASPALASSIEGRARVLDGDTIEIRGERIRIHGIDAPEGGQMCTGAKGKPFNCGATAKQALAGKLKGRPVACERKDTDQFGRMVAVCRAGSLDVGRWMVQNGYAIAFIRYSEDYVSEESTARASRRGMWAGQFEPPWGWRAKQRATQAARAAAQTSPRPGCDIKGNVNRRGDRIYHLPGGRHYAQTRIDPKAGGRWFCTEAEAKEAGWRAPRGG